MPTPLRVLTCSLEVISAARAGEGFVVVDEMGENRLISEGIQEVAAIGEQSGHTVELFYAFLGDAGRRE